MEANMQAKEVLKKVFGYDSYKKGQEPLINGILAGRDVLGIMPTGAGKSICYQVPALVLPGLTLVISPLISLMQDQVKALNEAGIHAGYINSSLTEGQVRKVYNLARLGTFKIIYVAPERLENAEFLEFAAQADISMVTVDEAHCISQWGQDFRPSYLKIIDFISGLPKRPIVSAFTATATEEVKEDIICVLQLRDPEVVVTGFDRENLYFSVETIRNKDDFVASYIQKHPNESGIIYCATRKNVDFLHLFLTANGVPAARYHAGMTNEDRKASQDDFIFDRLPIIVATNAFGMGIDKSNVRFVLHYNMPQSMENYYQEAGRAGRDGGPAACILLFSAQDVMIAKYLLDHKDFSEVSEEDAELIRQRDQRRLHVMEGYCRTTGCLRNYILGYFGEKTEAPCDNCGNCHRDYKETDVTEAAKQIINCVFEMKGRYGLSIVIGTLVGAKRARLREIGADQYQSYGRLKEYSEAELRQMIAQMVQDGYLIQTEDKYSVLRLGDISALRNGDARVVLRTYEEKEPERRSRKSQKKGTDALTGAGYDLFEILRNTRLAIAREEAVPPYIVFSDKTLLDMCGKLPQSRSAMLHVLGVGEMKYDKYGERFLAKIQEFIESRPGVVTAFAEDDEPARTNAKDSKRKADFSLRPGDADSFACQDMALAGDIRDELNRITTVENVKKLHATQIVRFLKECGYVEESRVNGLLMTMPTPLGAQKGIKTEERISQAGNPYPVILYPSSIQEEIVAHYTRR